MAPRKKRPGAAIHFTVDVSGVRGMQQVLNAMPRTLRTMVLQPIVKQLAEAGARAAKANLQRMLPPRDPDRRWWDRPTGALADSLGQKVVPASKMRNKDLVYGLYGARRDFRVTASTRRNVASIRRTAAGPLPVGRIMVNGRQNRRSGAIQPSKYIHLVEKGHKGAPQYNIPPARAYPFIAASRAQLQAVMPQILRQQWNTRYADAVGRLTRRYLKQASRATR